MAIKMLLVFTCFSLACCLVWAGPSQVQVRSEEGRWIAEILGVSSDGWPEIISRKSFANREQANFQAQQWQKNSSLETQSSLNFSAQVTKGRLWTTTQTWSEEWEQKYAQWIEKEVDAEFFVRYKLATDCADVAYSLRWIFARIHGLPAAATLGGSNILLTNETLRSQWASLPTSQNWYEDKRFLAALNYLLELTYTHTLWGDSFPVALTKEALLSGSYHLSLREESGHTQLIHWMDASSGVPFLALNSTIPRKVRSLMDSMLSATAAKDKKSAILRFRWAVKNSSSLSLKKATEMPGYSLEQFSFNPPGDYTIALFEKLGYTGGKEGIRDYLYKDILAQFKARVEVVKGAIASCKDGACRPGTPAWEEWSTPSRDSRINGKISSLRSLGPDLANPALSEVIVSFEGVSWDLRSLIYNWTAGEFSSDPQDSEDIRWGAGGDVWAERQFQNFQKLLSARQEVLRKGALACAGKNCRFGTELWKKTSSSEIDATLAKKIRYLNQGDGHLPSQVVQKLDSFRKSILINISGQAVTLEHLLNSFASMNASALASEQKQWSLGEWSTLPVQQIFGPKVISNRWMLDQGLQEVKVWDLETGKKLNLPLKPRLIFYGETLIAEGPQGNALLNLKNQSVQSLPLELQSAKIEQMLPLQDHLVVTYADRMKVWKLDEKILTLTPEREIAGTKWKHTYNGIFTSEESLYDFNHDRTFTQYASKIVTCASKQYVALGSSQSGFTVIKRDTGMGRELEISNVTSLDCEVQKLTTLNLLNRHTTVYHWNDQIQLNAEFEMDKFCYLFGDSLHCVGGTTYLFKNGKWQRSEEIKEGIYQVRTKAGERYEVVERATGKVIIEGKRLTLVGDRYAVVTLSEEEKNHVIDLKNIDIPVLTNIFKSDWGAGVSMIGPYIFLAGYSESGEGGSVFWRPAAN